MTFSRFTPALATILLSVSAAIPSAWAQEARQNNAQPTTGDTLRSTYEQVTGNPLGGADTDMRHVVTALGSLASLGPKLLPKLDAPEARRQPSAADAAMEMLREQGKSTLPDPSETTKNILVDGAQGKIAATVYKPENAAGTLAVIVYYHGGGFVIANTTTYAASCIELAKGVGAVVVEVEYSKLRRTSFRPRTTMRWPPTGG